MPCAPAELTLFSAKPAFLPEQAHEKSDRDIVFLGGSLNRFADHDLADLNSLSTEADLNSLWTEAAAWASASAAVAFSCGAATTFVISNAWRRLNGRGHSFGVAAIRGPRVPIALRRRRKMVPSILI